MARAVFAALFAAPALTALENPGLIPFATDAGTEISDSKTYTHTLNFGPLGNSPVINGVTFHSVNATDSETYNYAGAPENYHNGAGPAMDNIRINDSESVFDLLLDVRHGTLNDTLVLSGLEPFGMYEFRIYSRNWDIWTGGEQSLQEFVFFPGTATERVFYFDPDSPTNTAGVIVAYSYIANSAGEFRMDYNFIGPDGHSWFLYGLSNEEVRFIPEPAKKITDISAILGIRVPLPADVDYVTVYWKPDDGGTNEEGWGEPDAGSATAMPETPGSVFFNALAAGLASDTDYVFNFEVVYTNSAVHWSTLGEFKTRDDGIEISASPATDITGAEAFANGVLDWAGSEFGEVDITCYWGEGDPNDGGAWGKTPITRENETAGSFDFHLTGLNEGMVYHYRFFATNSVTGNFAETGVCLFQTKGREFFWGWFFASWNPIPWTDTSAAWYFDPDHSGGYYHVADYPRLPCDIASFANNGYYANPHLSGRMTIGELNFSMAHNNPGAMSPVRITAEAGGVLDFDNGICPAVISKTYDSYSVIEAPVNIDKSLIVRGPATSPIVLSGVITGADRSIKIETGLLVLDMEHDDSFAENFTGGGRLGKDGAGTLTLSGDNVINFEVAAGELVFDGGSLTNPNTGITDLFTAAGASLVFANACKVATFGAQRMNFSDQLTVTGTGTEWNFNANALALDGDGNMALITDGALVKAGAVTVRLGNMLAVSDAAELNAGDITLADVAGGDTPAKLRTSGGGVVNCANLTVAAGNGLSPALTDERPIGLINVLGEATFNDPAYVWPVFEKGAPTGNYLILQAETLTGAEANLKLSPDTDESYWRLRADETVGEVWLTHTHPATVIIIK
ncbi:MAG: hypothetical protein FWG05_02405 [Kiritimatiellaeota bacterium]|nr:hypothetical protein [Kiritimatiellota bacterium]